MTIKLVIGSINRIKEKSKLCRKSSQRNTSGKEIENILKTNMLDSLKKGGIKSSNRKNFSHWPISNTSCFRMTGVD